MATKAVEEINKILQSSTDDGSFIYSLRSGIATCDLEKCIRCSLDGTKCENCETGYYLNEGSCLLDESNKDFYLGNAKSYIEKINELQKKGIQIVNNSKTKVMVVADRFPFLYFAKDFGLEYFAAFEGCSSETDASFDVILALSEKMIEHNLSSIVITETGNDKLVKTIIQQVEKSRTLNGVEKVQSSDIQIKVLNSIQGKVLDSESYLSIMNKNLEILFSIYQ